MSINKKKSSYLEVNHTFEIELFRRKKVLETELSNRKTVLKIELLRPETVLKYGTFSDVGTENSYILIFRKECYSKRTASKYLKWNFLKFLKKKRTRRR